MDNIKTKRIITKKEKNLRRLDIIFIFGCIIFVLSRQNFGMVKYLMDAAKVCDGNMQEFFVIVLSWLWMFLIKIMANCYIFIALYLGFRIIRMKKIKENSKYQVIDNIEYYREKFNNITPSEISLITDLEIETKKDITATILKLYQKGIVEFHNNKIVINDSKIDKTLKVSELNVIEMIKNNSFDDININKWKDVCVEEAKTNNFIKDKGKKEKGPKFIVTVALVTMAIIAMFATATLSTPWLDSNQELEDKLEHIPRDDSMTDMEWLLEFPEYKEFYIEYIKASTPVFIFGTMLLISIFSIVFIPLYRLVKRLTHTAIENKGIYERTNEGKILVEQIAGIKNYIHDFSLLSEREKEYVMLWEDFLIYAILLEENEQIVNDIFKYKNMNLDIKSNLNTLLDIV